MLLYDSPKFPGIHISYYLHSFFVSGINYAIMGALIFSHTTELLEIQSDKPTCHVLFIPGNPGQAIPFDVCYSIRRSNVVFGFWIMRICSSFGLLINAGVVSFYKDFLESLYELLGASASVTGIYLFLKQMSPFFLFNFEMWFELCLLAWLLINSYWAHISHWKGNCFCQCIFFFLVHLWGVI